MYKVYGETRPLYLETDVSGLGLGVGLLQIRDGINCPQDVALDNSMLRPITFASKSLSSAERQYGSRKREALRILHGIREDSSLLLCKGNKYSNRPQVNCSHFQEGHCNVITKATMNIFNNSPIQDQNTI